MKVEKNRLLGTSILLNTSDENILLQRVPSLTVRNALLFYKLNNVVTLLCAGTHTNFTLDRSTNAYCS